MPESGSSWSICCQRFRSRNRWKASACFKMFTSLCLHAQRSTYIPVKESASMFCFYRRHYSFLSVVFILVYIRSIYLCSGSNLHFDRSFRWRLRNRSGIWRYFVFWFFLFWIRIDSPHYKSCINTWIIIAYSKEKVKS